LLDSLLQEIIKMAEDQIETVKDLAKDVLTCKAGVAEMDAGKSASVKTAPPKLGSANRPRAATVHSRAKISSSEKRPVKGSITKGSSPANRLRPPTASSVVKNKMIGASRGPRTLSTVGNPSIGATRVRKSAQKNSPNVTKQNARVKKVEAEPSVQDRQSAVARDCSTPTKEGSADNGLDAWDASQICGVNKSQVVNFDDTNVTLCSKAIHYSEADSTTLSVEGRPRKPSLNTSAILNSSRVGAKRTASSKMRKPSVAIKALGNTILEDPDDISEDLMDDTYARYIQSVYINKTSKQALEKTKKDCDSKLSNVWLLVEQTRQELLQVEQQLHATHAISNIQDTVSRVGPLLGIHSDTEAEEHQKDQPLFEHVQATQQKLKELCQGLEDVGHNIEVKGVRVDTDHRAMVADKIGQLVRQFNEMTRSVDQVRSAQVAEKPVEDQRGLLNDHILLGMASLEKFCRESENISAITQEYSTLIETLHSLALKESSLKMSFKQLETWKQAENESG